MRLSHVQIDIVNCLEDRIKSIIEEAHRDFDPAGLPNDKTEQMLEYYIAGIRLAIAQTLTTLAKKKLDGEKKTLDRIVAGSNINAGETVSFFNSNGITFSKKRNNDTSTVDSKQLLIELAKAGIDHKVINECEDKATKPRRGNTYYIVEDT